MNPVYTDGPLRGTDYAVPGHILRSGALSAHDGETVVTYRFHKFALLGRIIWIGAVGAQDAINETDLFDMIASDRAKQASEVW